MGERIVCCGETCQLPDIDLRGLLSFWLLWELRLGPLLGAQLAERLEWRRGAALSPGTLYPALSGLVASGHLKKRAQGRDTQYLLTPVGNRDLACARDYLGLVFRDVFGHGRVGVTRAGTR